MSEDIFRGLGVEVTLASKDDFLKICETLTRIGVASRKDKTIYQSCHILHKQGRYVIIHFKELFILDGKESSFTDDDKGRRNTITSLLAQWGLLSVKDPQQIVEPLAPLNRIKVLPHKEKPDWQLVAKYTIGKKH